MSDTASDDEPSEPPDPSTWSSDDTGSHRVDRELQRELVRAALFDGRSAPRIGRFIVAERLGAGASSVVYAAWDDLLARRVAVKIFVADMVATQDQFQREAHALGQLSHRNVVAVYDVGEWKDHAFIAMELIAGETLARWQSSRKRSTEELIDAYLQAGRGLAAAHQAGLVHRDFKPANVMVASDGRVVVTDFGLAGNVAPDARDTEVRGPAGSGVSTRPVLGTPAYVAPEQRSGSTPHPSADLYSFSVALCEALIGWHPMRDTEPAWRRALARRVPRRISEAIATGLSRQPADRGDTMSSLLMALTPAPRRRRRGAALVLAGLAAAVVVVGFKLSCDGARAKGRELPPPFHAPSLHALVHQIDAALAAPPGEDRAAAAALRALVLAPLPAELRCDWPAPLAALAFTDGHAIGLDDSGRVHGCALATGAMSLVTTGARCIATAGALIGVFGQDWQPRILRATAAGWRDLRVAPHPPLARWPPAPNLPCAFDIALEPGGSVRLGPGPGRIARDGAGRITSVAAGDELRIVDGAGVALARRALPAGQAVPLLDVSRDGSRVLAASLHGPLAWWQAGTGWRDEPLHFRDPTLTRARLSPSGTRALVLDFFGHLEVRHLGGGTLDWLASDSITDATFLDDDTVIGSDADHRLWRWDVAAPRAGIAAIHDGAVWSVASNAEIIASASEGGGVTLVDRRTGAPRRELRVASDVYKLLLDGDRLVAGGNDGMRIWDWRSGTLDASADGEGLRIWDVQPATAADGSRLYLAGTLGRAAILAWDTRAQTRLYWGTPQHGITDIAVSDDGRTAAMVTFWGELVVVDVAHRTAWQLTAHAWGPAYHVAFDAETRTIVTVGHDGYLRTWAPPAIEPRRSVRISASAVYGLDVHRGLAITAGHDGSVTLVDLARGEIVRRYRGHNGAARTVQFRGDGEWFVTGGNDLRACLWRIDDEDCHTWLDGHADSVLGATFADDGTIFTTSNDGTVRYWRPTYDQPVSALVAELAGRGSQR